MLSIWYVSFNGSNTILSFPFKLSIATLTVTSIVFVIEPSYVFNVIVAEPGLLALSIPYLSTLTTLSLLDVIVK